MFSYSLSNDFRNSYGGKKMANVNDYVYVEYQDLKKDILVTVTFESMDDCLKFFSMYNPLSIHIKHCEAFIDGE